MQPPRRRAAAGGGGVHRRLQWRRRGAHNELVIGVNIALGLSAGSACPAFDASGDERVTINELVAAVNDALNGCIAGPTPTGTPSGPTPTATPSALTFAPIGNRNVALGSTLTLQLSAFDPEGRVLAFSLMLTASAPASFAYEYQYDGAGRLKSRGPGAGGAGVVMRYELDAASRITRVSSASPDGSAVLADFRHTYDALGNVLTSQDEGGTTTYAYDALSQVTSASGPAIDETYTYDAVGNRRSKNGLNYAYDIANSRDHAVSMTRGGATYYYVYDRLGSVVGLTNGAGELVVGYRYDPWGNLLAASGSNPGLENPFRFTSREWDAESGLYYYRLRYYDPAVGRFISRDPLGSGYVYAAGSGFGAAAASAEAAGVAGAGQTLVTFLTHPFTKLGVIYTLTNLWAIEYIKRHPDPNAPCRQKY